MVLELLREVELAAVVLFATDAPPPPPTPASMPYFAAARPKCEFGAKCYRKNPAHRVDTCHPGDPDWDATPQAVTATGRPARGAAAKKPAYKGARPSISLGMRGCPLPWCIATACLRACERSLCGPPQTRTMMTARAAGTTTPTRHPVAVAARSLCMTCGQQGNRPRGLLASLHIAAHPTSQEGRALQLRIHTRNPPRWIRGHADVETGPGARRRPGCTCSSGGRARSSFNSDCDGRRDIWGPSSAAAW